MSKFNALQDQVVDIMSSGMGEMEEWHVSELKEAILEANLTEEEKIEYFKTIFVPNTFLSEGWAVSDIKLMKKLLGIDQQVTITL